MLYDHGLIGPAVALILWSLVIFVWMYATRIPAMQAAKIKPGAATKAQMEALPPWASNVAANYNHLMEQPTIFYAVCFALQFLDQTQTLNIQIAWAYVGLRVLHSLIQCTVNIIVVRFLVFTLSTILLAMLAVHAALAMWG